jgi:Fe-S-cluster containining protein
LAAEKEAENLEFRRYLRQHHEADGLFFVVAQRVEAQVDCRQCGNCCLETRVTVSEAEIAAIASFLGMPVSEVVRQYTEADAVEHSLLLAQPGGGACVFFDKGLCLVYEARPLACREFPHVDTGHASLGSRLESIGRHASICPILYGAFEEMKHVVGYHARHH